MTREERLTNIFTEFDTCVHKLCEDTHGVFCEIIPIYKGEERAQNLKYRRAFIVYNSFAVEIKYTAHAMMNVSNSILECLIRLDKDEDGMAVPLPLLLDYLDVDESAPMYIPSISDEVGMQEAFDCIGDVLVRNLGRIADACGDARGKENAIDAYKKDISLVLEVTLNDENFEFYINDNLYMFFTLRFTSAPFINYIKGDVKTAVKQLGKVKKRIGYEERMLRLWQSGRAAQCDLSSVSESLNSYSKGGVQGGSAKELLAMLVAWLFLLVVISPFAVGFYLLLMFLESRGSVYLMGPIYNIPYCFLFAFLAAIAASYFLRFKAYKLLFPKDFERFAAADHIQNGVGGDKLMKGFLTVIAICGIAGAILLAKWNINFKPDGFIDNSKFLSLRGEYYEYDDVERIYYRPSRVNDFGETLDFPSYVLVLKDGKEIDFYELDEIEKYENELINFLREKGIAVDDSAKQ